MNDETKFLSADDLGITEKQRCGLVETLVWLQAGAPHKYEDGTTPSRFDMESWNGACGTACCIGGSATVFGEVSYGPFRPKGVKGGVQMGDTQLGALFYPGTNPGEILANGGDWTKHPGWKATPAQGAVALKHYLETGKADWDMAMKVKP